jgi:hypothetical protein
MFVLVATEVLFSSFDLYTDEDVEAQHQICGQALRLKIIRWKVCAFDRRRRLCYTSNGLASDHSPDQRHRRWTTRVRSRILTRSPHCRVATGRSSSPRDQDSRQRPSSGVTFVLLLLGMKRPQQNDLSSRRGGGYDIAILHLLYARGDVRARHRHRVVPPPDVPPPVNFHPSSKSSVGRVGSQCAIRPTRTKCPDCIFDGDRECAPIVRPDGDPIEG